MQVAELAARVDPSGVGVACRHFQQIWASHIADEQAVARDQAEGLVEAWVS
ncbi:MAG: hypothetical protein IPK17_21675 [Chloroflexi bacterium]|uniref:hypothetical protein n=1 Tax=Candidatus Flexifilum breve TaxID=3140694 RepID=UPI003136708E|nr:hypothetical protein [Chloroflexota bacterium]